MGDSATSWPTIPESASGTKRRENILRGISIGFLGVVVVAGLLGLLGVRTETARASANGYTISVTHAAVTRAGLATPFSVEIVTTDGTPLPSELTTRIETNYLEMFDENGLEPEPAFSFQTPKWTWWTFEVPEGQHEIEVSFDARLEPAVQWGRSGSAAVEIDGEEMTEVEFETWVMP